jgi:F-type H+-transporting ATPase subunit c
MTRSIFTDHLTNQRFNTRSFDMDAEAARLLGAGLAAIGVGMAALGVGNVFGSFLESALRNPAAADSQQGRLFIGFAAAELLGLLAFVVAMILLFVVGG